MAEISARYDGAIEFRVDDPRGARMCVGCKLHNRGCEGLMAYGVEVRGKIDQGNPVVKRAVEKGERVNCGITEVL